MWKIILFLRAGGLRCLVVGVFLGGLFLVFEAAFRQFIQRSLQYRYLKNASLHVKLNWV